jgi:hypothetical protein
MHNNHHPVVSACPTCGVAATGNFCASCGESVNNHMPSAGEFLHEFVGHYVALEGKLWKTLKLLVLRPGQLTVDFLHGRRVPFIQPLRLYLTLSLVVFALIKMFSIELPKIVINDHGIAATYSHVFTSQSTSGKPGVATATFQIQESDAEKKKDKNLTSVTFLELPSDFNMRELIARVGQVNTRWMHALTRFMNESDEKRTEALNHGFLAYLPYMLIGALPLFALYLKIVYLGSSRRYGEHLVFALHTSAFAFLMASLMIVIPGSIGWILMAPFLNGAMKFVSAWDYFQILPFLYLVAYLPIAMQRVYGGSRVATACRWLVVIAAHLLVIFMATLVAELIGIMHQA